MEKEILFEKLAMIGINVLAENHNYLVDNFVHDLKPNEILESFIREDLKLIHTFWPMLSEKSKALIINKKREARLLLIERKKS